MTSLQISAVADTHTAVWWLQGGGRVSERVRLLIESAAANGQVIGVSSVSIAELIYLVEKGRLPVEALSDLESALVDPRHVFVEVAFDNRVASSMQVVPRAAVPDMPDRMIAATAVAMGVPLLTVDRKIRSSATPTIW